MAHQSITSKLISSRANWPSI